MEPFVIGERGDVGVIWICATDVMTLALDTGDGDAIWKAESDGTCLK